MNMLLRLFIVTSLLISSPAYATFTTVFDRTTQMAGTDDGDGDQQVWTRLRIAASSWSTAAAGTSVRITILWGASSPTVTNALVSLWFGQAGASKGDFTGDQISLTCTSNNSSAAGTATCTGTLAQNFDNTKDYVASYMLAQTGSMSVAETNTAGATLYIGTSASDVAGTTTMPTELASNGDTALVEKIEIDVSGGGGGGGTSNTTGHGLNLLGVGN